MSSFWWEEKKDLSKRVPSLDTGITNSKSSVNFDSIFSNENFKSLESMFDESELAIAKYKVQNRSIADIAEILGISVEEVNQKIGFMTAVYKKTFPEASVKPNYRTINSKMGR